MRVTFVAAMAFAATLLAVLSNAQDRDAIVLTVDGAIDGGQPRDFSIADLEALGTSRIVTGTPWHDGKVAFEGVLLEKLMETVGATGTTALITALNNYSGEVPISDFSQYGMILATKKDGSYMPVSDKGPLFVIYPFDDHAELNSELYFSRSVWQVRSISVE